MSRPQPGVTAGRSSSRSSGSNYTMSMMSRFMDNRERRRIEEEAADNAAEAELGKLKVDTVEFYIRQNAKNHHTEMYELTEGPTPNPVLRRGQNFFIAIRFKERNFDPEKDKMRLVFRFGPKASVPKGTRVNVPIKLDQPEAESKSQFGCKVVMQHELDMQLELDIPANFPVGVWKMSIQTWLQGVINKRERHLCPEDIFVLFNPWCKDDSVYMQNDNYRKEYVLNDVGKVWVGTHKNTRGRRWVFGQFDDVSLPSAMYVLETSTLRGVEKANPVKITRALSQLVNSMDGKGILEGRWDGEYEDGTAPYVWTGSVAILEEFLKTGGQPVKYGQCWVFSAITTTLCRALGIPCRSVTNFVSAHDTNSSLTIDKFYDANGQEIEGGPDGDNYDSIWNFHVWNDVWMSRPDLPVGYGGWQAIDATPQEESDGGFRCGPCSVEAVRRGEVGFGYDAPFVFSEVNADVCHWKVDDESDWGFSLLKSSQYHVGRKILTKHPERDDDRGDRDVEDVINQYKNREGSGNERLAIMNAVRGVEKAQQYFDVPPKGTEDVTFDLVEIEKILIGQPFRITVNLSNNSNELRTIYAMLSCSSVYYTGVRAKGVKQQSGSFKLNPGQAESLSITVMPQEYLDKLVDYSMMKIYAVTSVKETRQSWAEEDDFLVEKPVLDIQVPETGNVNQRMEVTFSFTNPLTVPLSNCRFSFEGPGLQRPRILRFRDVGPNETVTHKEAFTPRRLGPKKIVGTFSSSQLIEVNGSATVNIQE